LAISKLLGLTFAIHTKHTSWSASTMLRHKYDETRYMLTVKRCAISCKKPKENNVVN